MSKFVKFLMSVVNWLVNSSSNFQSFFIVMTHNTPVNVKLMLFLFWTKDPIKVPILTLSSVLVEISPNYKSVFLEFLYGSSVLWKMFPLYFFRSNVICFARKVPIKVQIFETFECSHQNSPTSKLTKFFSFLKQQISFPLNFPSLFIVMRSNSSAYY